MKKNMLIVSTFALMLLIGAGCSNTTTNNNNPTSNDDQNKVTSNDTKSLIKLDDKGVARINNEAFYKELGKHVGDKATPGDKMALPFIYESQKMAENLFSNWSKIHKLEILSELADSHKTQRETLEAVMGSLQVDLSSAALEAGKFKDAKVQALYDKLSKQGNEMRVKAFTSGLIVEETSIKNINTYLERGIDGISKTVFEGLKEASEKNIKVLNDLLVAEGATYTPQAISQAEFDKLVK